MLLPFRSRRLRGIRHFGAISSILMKHGFGEVMERLRGRKPAKDGGAPSGCPIRHAFAKPWRSWGPVSSNWAS
jgi:ubiquinone biosynthesis protein